MTMAQAQIDFLIEVDQKLGMPVFHLFPSHQEHIPALSCPCSPHLGDFYETGEGLLVEVWWHWKKRSD